jgi:hypothetical protein
MNQTIQLPSDDTVLSLDVEVSIRHLYISPGHNVFGHHRIPAATAICGSNMIVRAVCPNREELGPASNQQDLFSIDHS